MAESSDSDKEIVTALLLIKDLEAKGKERLLMRARDLYKEKEEKGAYRMLIEEMKHCDREY